MTNNTDKIMAELGNISVDFATALGNPITAGRASVTGGALGGFTTTLHPSSLSKTPQIDAVHPMHRIVHPTTGEVLGARFSPSQIALAPGYYEVIQGGVTSNFTIVSEIVLNIDSTMHQIKRVTPTEDIIIYIDHFGGVLNPPSIININKLTGEQENMTQAQKKQEEPINQSEGTQEGLIEIVNNGVLGGLDTMLAAATGGKVTKFEEIVNKYNKSTQEIEALQKTVKKVKESLVKAQNKAIPTTGTEIINAEELTYELVMQQANDIFFEKYAGSGKPKKDKQLEFMIPTLVWKDKAGTVVRHPECPEIDENYQLTTLQLIKFLTAFSKGLNTWLYGHTGTGKSTFVEQVAARIGFPVSRVNLDSNLERADLVGHIALRQESGATISKYEEGVLPRAMQRPGFMLLDEIDAGRPDILFVIQRALEGSGLMLTEDHGRIVKPHPLFRFVATANTRGQGDEYGIYQGTRNLNTAMIDRFPVFMEFKYLPKDVEIKLLQSVNPDLDSVMSEQMVVFANEVRGAFSNGEVFQPITPRGLHRLAELYLHFEQAGIKKPMATALEMTVFDKTTRDTIQKVKELADRCLKAA